ncbi:MAG: hypothetical protein QXF26_03620 [Candidatus Bathyarchaeia archaeon]
MEAGTPSEHFKRLAKANNLDDYIADYGSLLLQRLCQLISAARAQCIQVLSNPTNSNNTKYNR